MYAVQFSNPRLQSILIRSTSLEQDRNANNMHIVCTDIALRHTVKTSGTRLPPLERSVGRGRHSPGKSEMGNQGYIGLLFNFSCGIS